MKNKRLDLRGWSNLYEALSPKGLIPPQQVELEESLLGSAMVSKDAAERVIGVLGPDKDPSVFYRDAHAAIYRSMLELDRKNEAIDMLTVKAQLESDQMLDLVGGPAYLVEVTTKIVSTVNVETYSRLVLEAWMKRELVRACEEIKLRAFEGELDAFNMLDDLETYAQEIRGGIRNNKGLRHAKAGWDALWKEISTPVESGIRGLPIGIPDFDMMSGGLSYSEQTVLAALPSRGKTALCAQIADNMLNTIGRGVAFFSLETTESKVLKRFLIGDTEVDRQALNAGKLQPREWMDVKESIERQKKLPLYIDDSGIRSVFDIRAEIKKISKKVDLGLVIVDYVQLCKPLQNVQTREREVAEISAGLRALWKEFGVVGLCLSQFNRGVTDAAPPQLRDLRESGSLEQDARQIIFIHYPHRKNQEEIPDIERVQLILAKNTDGPVGHVEVEFDKRIGRFYDSGTQPILTRKLEPIVKERENGAPF